MTLPFGAALETALKGLIQNGKFSLAGGFVRNPRFFCCISGNPVGVDKAPVALLVVRPIRVCTATAVTADYSRSWSPTSTINAWQVNWGDGNVSNGVWPGAGSVNHPLGGYVLPGIYTVTLTVTDLLGATDVDTQQVEVLDCTLIPDIEMFAGCGSSGPWYTFTGGRNWENVGGGILDGIQIYDLKVSWFSNGHMWAATASGLYKRSKSSGRNVTGWGPWQLVTLPDPDGNGSPVAYAIACSPLIPTGCYLLTQQIATGDIYIYATTTGGTYWTYMKVESGGAGGQVLSLPDLGLWTNWYTSHQFAAYNSKLYFAEPAETMGMICRPIYERAVDGSWASIGCGMCGGILPGDCIAIAGGNTNLWTTGDFNATPGSTHASAYWDGAWHYTTPWGRPSGTDVIVRADTTTVAIGRGNNAVDNSRVDYFQEADDTFIRSSTLFPWNQYRYMRTIAELGGTMFASVRNVIVPQWEIMREVSQHNWVTEYIGNQVTDFAQAGGILYANYRGTQLLVRNNGTATWALDGHVCAANIQCMWSYGGSIYVGAGSNIYQRTAGGYVLVCTPAPGLTVNAIANHGGQWFAACVVSPPANNVANGIYACPTGSAFYTIPTVGRTHLIDVSSNGEYAYFSILDDAANPVVFRMATATSVIEEIHNPGAGTWGGVKADWFYFGRLWIFGDFGAASKALMTEDWGDNFTDVTDAGWGAGEIVRPMLPSLYDPDNVIAILNTALQAHESSDAGASWANNGALPFACHCGVRDWIEDNNLLLGRVNAGALHLAYSHNLGVAWLERSTGVTANAPITAIEIVG